MLWSVPLSFNSTLQFLLVFLVFHCKYPTTGIAMDVGNLQRDELVFEVGIRGYAARAKDSTIN